MNLQPFVFCTERRLVALTGLRTTNLPELLELLREVPGSAIFYHTHHMYLSHHFERTHFTNDFALWVGEALQEDALSEKLAAIDLLSFTSIRSIRDAITAIIENYHALFSAWSSTPSTNLSTAASCSSLFRIHPV